MILTKKIPEISEADIGKFIEVDVDLCVINDNDVSFEAIKLLGENLVFNKDKVVIIADQIIPPNTLEVSRNHKLLMEFAQKQDIELYYGVGMTPHLLTKVFRKSGLIEVGSVKAMYGIGAVGSLGFHVDSKKLADVMKTGILSIRVPKIINVELRITPEADYNIKDAALSIIQTVGTHGFDNAIVNIVGEGVKKLTENERLIICTMLQKTGAYAVIIDKYESEESIKYSFDINNIKSKAVLENGYDKIVDISEMKCTKINAVYIGGTVGGFLEDIKITSEAVKGKSIAYGVRLVVSPATSEIYKEAASLGYIEDILDAGGIVINQCGNPEVQGRIGENEVLISNDIINDKGYAGFDSSKIFITSTSSAVSAAMKGFIGDVDTKKNNEQVIEGRVWKLGDDIDTDIIIPTQYVCLPTMAEMKSHAFEPLRPDLASMIKEGDIIVAGENFGCGSSREMAAEVIVESGIKCIIAKSFARIFFRNAINNGILLIESKDLPDNVTEGDFVKIELNNKITHKDKDYKIGKIAENLYEIIRDGGLVKNIKNKVQKGLL